MIKFLTQLLFILVFSFFQNVNAQQFGEDTGAWLLKIMYGEIKTADLDGDGDQDLIVSGQAGLNGDGNTYIYFNNGNGGFSLNQYHDLPHVLFSTIALGDIDNDGDLDLFISGTWDSSGTYTSIYKNDGTGHFEEENPYEFTMVTLGSSLFLDVNGDNKLDLFYFGRGVGSSGITKLYLNSGNGQFVDTPVSIQAFQSGSLVAADYDKDGDLDLLISGQTNPNGDITKLYKNDGSGVFTEVEHNFVGIFDGSAVFSDIDNDDDLDVIVNGRKNGVNTYHSEFHLNDGLGNFINVGNRGLDSLGGCSLALADVDMDGDEDVFLTGKTKAGADTCALYYNQNGFFTKDAHHYSQGLTRGGSLFANLDDNCSPDLVYFGFGDNCLTQTYCFMNNGKVDCPVEDENENESSFGGITVPTYKVISNPFSDIIRVEVSEKVLKAAVYDLTGRLVFEYSPDSNTIEIAMMEFAPGNYNLKFNTVDLQESIIVKLAKIN